MAPTPPREITSIIIDQILPPSLLIGARTRSRWADAVLEVRWGDILHEARLRQQKKTMRNGYNLQYSRSQCVAQINVMCVSGDDAVRVAAATSRVLVRRNGLVLRDDAVRVAARATGILVGGGVDNDEGRDIEGVHADLWGREEDV